MEFWLVGDPICTALGSVSGGLHMIGDLLFAHRQVEHGAQAC